MKKTLTTIILFLLLGCFAMAQTPAQTLPEFKLFRLDDRAFSNKDLTPGKMTFLVFFDPDCEHCQHAIKIIGQQYKSFKKPAIYLISNFSPNKINLFMNTYGLPLKAQKNVTILQDKLNLFISTFKPRKYPSMFLYSSQNKLIDYEDDPAMIDKFIKAIAGK